VSSGSKSKELELKVLHGYPRDYERRLARIHTSSMEAISVTAGDTIEVSQDNMRTIVKCLPLSPGEEDDVIRIDEDLRNRIALSIESSVRIRKITALIASQNTSDFIPFHSGERLKAQALERLKGADSMTAEILRAQIEEMDWLINEGGKHRTMREIALEHERLDREIGTSEGLDRLRIENRIRSLEMAAHIASFRDV
jgi:hypothetical protein